MAARNTVPLRPFVAGVMFEERFVFAQELTLNHRLHLVRQPDNPFDPNAIQVVEPEMGVIGYLPRQLAAVLAGPIDIHEARIEARVIELIHEPVTQHVRVRIGFEVPSEWLLFSPLETSADTITYHIQRSNDSSYLFLNCNAEQLLNISEVLPSHNFAVIRSGYSFWPASNAIQYEWYVKLPLLSEQDIARLEDLLTRRFHAVSDERNRNKLAELTQEYQKQITLMREKLLQAEQEKREAWRLGSEIEAEKEREITFLSSEIERLMADLEQLKQQQGQLRRERESLYQSLAMSEKAKAHFGDKEEELQHVFLDIVSDSLTPRRSLEVIQALFADRIVVLPDAFRSAEDSKGFHHRAELFQLLWKLAKEYWLNLVNGGSDVNARAIFGDSFSARESETTASNQVACRYREFDYKGRKLKMVKHLKIGVKDSPAETIRVHFEWIADEQKIVIGHCGPHLPLR